MDEFLGTCGTDLTVQINESTAARISGEALALFEAPRGIVERLPRAARMADGMSPSERAAALDRMFHRVAANSGDFEGADGVYSLAVHHHPEPVCITDPRQLYEPRPKQHITGKNGMPSDYTVFGFGDTYVGQKILGFARIPPSRFNFIRHTVSVMDDRGMRTIVRDFGDRAKDIREWMQPLTGRAEGASWRDREWYWPGDMTQTDAGVQLILARFEHNGPDPYWDWGRIGTDMATIDPATFNIIEQVPINNDVTGWGAAIHEAPDHTYIYGSEPHARGDFAGLTIARSSRADATKGWEYLTKDGAWSPNHVDAMIDTQFPVASQFSVIDSPLGGVDLIVQPGFDPVVNVHHAPSPEGPFEATGIQIPVPGVTFPRYVYNALVHPQWSDAERLVMSVNMNRFDSIGLHPRDYRPRFFSVPRPHLIDPENLPKVEYGK